MAITTKHEAYDVSDSTDWLETPLPSLAPVDSALRCQVCRDFYVTPMITSCSHTFCSLCIRHCLGNDGKCPVCRKVDDASRLRNNYVVEELVDAFKRSRPDIMAYTKKSEEAVRSRSPKRKRVETEGKEEDRSPVRKRTRAGRRAQQNSQQVVVVDSDDDEDYVPEENQKPAPVSCPMCQDGFATVEAVQAHLDHCNGEPPSRNQRPKSTQTSIPPQQVSKLTATKRPDRLPQLTYGMMKDNLLRKKLQDLGLPTGGTRQLMERRYTEWVTLWNANCDSRNPKGKVDLRREMDVWERTQGGGAPIPSRANPGGNIRDKDFDGSAWSTKHDDSFRQLIEDAKKKRAAKAATPAETSKPDESSPALASNPMPPPVPYSSSYTSAPVSSTELPNFRLPVEAEVPSIATQPQNRSRSEIIPASPPGSSSQRRFFEESTVPVAFEPPSSRSSQPQDTQILDKDISMSSDMSTIRPLQP